MCNYNRFIEWVRSIFFGVLYSTASGFREQSLLKPPITWRLKALPLCSNHLRLSIIGKNITMLSIEKKQNVTFFVLKTFSNVYKLCVC